MIPWHRLFGLTLTDYFHDTAYKVEIEKDLSLKQQLLDVVILERKKGVYGLKWGVRDVRTIVTGQVPKAKRNLPWLLFSASPEKVTFGMRNYRWKIPASRVVSNIAKKYLDEEVFMTYTMEDFNRETREELLQSLTKEERAKFLKGLDPEERLNGLDPKELLKVLGPEELLKVLGPEERLKGLDPEELLKVLGPEKLIKALDPKFIEEYLRKIKARGHS